MRKKAVITVNLLIPPMSRESLYIGITKILNLFGSIPS